MAAWTCLPVDFDDDWFNPAVDLVVAQLDDVVDLASTRLDDTTDSITNAREGSLRAYTTRSSKFVDSHLGRYLH